MLILSRHFHRPLLSNKFSAGWGRVDVDQDSAILRATAGCLLPLDLPILHSRILASRLIDTEWCRDGCYIYRWCILGGFAG